MNLPTPFLLSKSPLLLLDTYLPFLVRLDRHLALTVNLQHKLRPLFPNAYVTIAIAVVKELVSHILNLVSLAF